MTKNNYQAPSERSIGRRQGGILELDRVSSLEAKFEALMTKLNQQTHGEPSMGEIAYMKAQEAIRENSTSQLEEANFVNNTAYVFQPNNNLPTYYHARLKNHENLSYGNQGIILIVPHQLSVSNAPPSFQGQRASSSNYQAKEDNLVLKKLCCIFSMI